MLNHPSGLVGLVLPLGLTLAVAGAEPAPDGQRAGSKEARQAIAQVLEAQQTAWNKGDLQGFMQGYWQSDRLTFFSEATRTSGWQGTLDRYRKRYQGEGREMGQLSFREIETEVLGPDSALVRGRWQLRLKDKTAGGLFTLIFRKLPEGWRIVHDHTSAGP
jgi:beta-aspartyl-peptidase (threonine type)